VNDAAFSVAYCYKPRPSTNPTAKKIPQIAAHSPSDSSKTNRIACPSLSRVKPVDGEDDPWRCSGTSDQAHCSFAVFLIRSLNRVHRSSNLIVALATPLPPFELLRWENIPRVQHTPGHMNPRQRVHHRVTQEKRGRQERRPRLLAVQAYA
jgi:hypothetical protein